MHKPKPISAVLSLATYADQACSALRLTGLQGGEEFEAPPLQIPVSIMYRLLYLGQAFDGQVAKMLKPSGSIRIDYVQMQRLISELEIVATAVSDPVTQHYLPRLLALLRSGIPHPGCALLIRSP